MVVDFGLQHDRIAAYVSQGARSKVKVNFQRWCLINTLQGIEVKVKCLAQSHIACYRGESKLLNVK